MAVCETQSREFVRGVSPSLKKGISALNDLTLSLLSVNKESVAKSDSAFGEIRSAVTSTQKNLSEAETAAASKLEAVDRCHEGLIVRKQDLSVQKENAKGKVRDLKDQQKNNKANLEMYKEAENNAERQLRGARNYLWEKERSVRQSKELRDAGIGITFIPIIGWIAGPIMIKAAEDEIRNANYKVQEAERLINTYRSSINEFNNKVSEYTWRIQEACDEITNTEDRLRKLDLEIEEVLEQKREIADFQEKMKKSVHVLGLLAGTSNVIELQTRCFVLLEVMIKLMQNFFKLVEVAGEDQLIRDDGIKALITKLQVNYAKMQAIAVPSETDAIKDYI